MCYILISCSDEIAQNVGVRLYTDVNVIMIGFNGGKYYYHKKDLRVSGVNKMITLKNYYNTGKKKLNMINVMFKDAFKIHTDEKSKPFYCIML